MAARADRDGSKPFAQGRPLHDSDFSSTFLEEWWTPERQALHLWLRRIAPHLAPIYHAGLRIVMDKVFPGRVHFVAHAIREIRNRLPDAVAGEIEVGAEYHDLARRVHEEWKGVGVSAFTERSEPSGAGRDRYEVSGGLMEAVSTLVDSYGRRDGRRRRNAERMFATLGGADPMPFVVDHWFRTDDWVHNYMHVGTTPHSREANEEVGVQFEQFERSLMVLSKGSSRPHENLEVLDGLLESANRR